MVFEPSNRSDNKLPCFHIRSILSLLCHHSALPLLGWLSLESIRAPSATSPPCSCSLQSYPLQQFLTHRCTMADRRERQVPQGGQQKISLLRGSDNCSAAHVHSVPDNNHNPALSVLPPWNEAAAVATGQQQQHSMGDSSNTEVGAFEPLPDSPTGRGADQKQLPAASKLQSPPPGQQQQQQYRKVTPQLVDCRVCNISARLTDLLCCPVAPGRCHHPRALPRHSSCAPDRGDHRRCGAGARAPLLHLAAGVRCPALERRRRSGQGVSGGCCKPSMSQPSAS